MERKRTDMNTRATRGETEEIDRRFLEGQAEGQQEIVDAANEAFVADQRDPTHPSRVDRFLGADDPSHSKGSARRREGHRTPDEE